MEDYDLIDGYIIRERVYKPEEESAKATVFALANGYMGLRGAGEELPPSIPGVKGCYINGIYDTPRGKLTEREFPNMPDWTLIQFWVDHDPFDPANMGELLDYHRELDMREGTVRRRIRWRTPSGKVVRVESERFLSASHLHVGVIRYRLSVEQPAHIVLHSSIDGAVNNRWAYHFKRFIRRQDSEEDYLEVETFEPGYRIGVMARHEMRTSAPLQIERDDPTDRSVRTLFTADLQPEQEMELTKWCVLYENRFSAGDLYTLCRAELDTVCAMGYDALRAEHASCWQKRWEVSDVCIEGDDDAQMGIRFAVFHLLAAAPFHDDRISIPARGLQGQDYYGSIFWDCEIFVLPLFTYTQPQVARNLLRYRYHTLAGAKRKAHNLGFQGAYYAWQSQETGDEQCDLYVFTNPITGEPIRSYFADEQIHISADIVYAEWQYVQATGDEQFWLLGGAEVALEAARFFVSRAQFNRDKGRYELRSVLGPDEYHERVNNNAYTNALARFSIEKALEVLDLLERGYSQECAALKARTGLAEDELTKWREVAQKLYVPAPDPQTYLIPQFDGYFDLRDEPVEETRKRLAHPDLHPGGPLGPYQETQNIKQADVVLLLYLLRDRYDTETKLANWRYYEPRTAHDSSLSPMAYSLVAADVGMVGWAYKYFLYTAHIDLASYGPHWNLGIHAASLGGAWQAVVNGFCQLELTLDGIRFLKPPVIPAHWKRVEFRVVWHGQPVQVCVSGDSTSLTALGEGEVPVLTPEGSTLLKPGESWQWRYKA
ncbi:MAG: glycoside hydrolase family 65 protein [Armatimonadota bacterium]